MLACAGSALVPDAGEAQTSIGERFALSERAAVRLRTRNAVVGLKSSLLDQRAFEHHLDAQCVASEDEVTRDEARLCVLRVYLHERAAVQISMLSSALRAGD